MNIKKLLIIFAFLIFLFISPCFGYENATDIPVGADYGDVYFDSSSLTDGDGSIDNPYNKITMDRINNYATLHLADGEYNVTGSKSISSLSIVGESYDKTILRHDGLLFTVSSKLTLENLTFSGSTFKNRGLINCTNVIFSDSKGTSADIYSNVFGGVFDNSGNKYTKPVLYLDNCILRNNHAEYGGAIYLINSEAFISNCLFENNIAYNYGGAIACDGSSKLNIKNTKFQFDSSTNDAGGALYLKNSSVDIQDSNFTNCDSNFGGAICDLFSNSTLSNVICSLNNAVYDGGAIFKMYGSLSILSSRFNFNTAKNGGGIFADNSSLLDIQSSRFSSNSANTGGAIYSLLNNNTVIKSVTYSRNKATNSPNLYETNPVNMLIGNNNYSMYKFNDTVVDDLPSRYSLIDEGYVTPVKDQQASGNCWAFAAIAALESCILKASNITYDLSEENLKNIIELYSDYGWKFDTNDGGNDNMALGYLLSWLGPVLEEDDLFDDYSTLSPVLDSIMHVQNVIYLGRDNFTDNNKIKEAILKYGAVATIIYFSNSYLLSDSYYYTGSANENHAVTIVGWDDDYPYYKFRNAAPANGAWIVKNSWNTDWADDGYFYVSYYDTRFARVGNPMVAYTFILNDTLRLDKNYQYDIIGLTDFFITPGKEIWYENIFNSTDDEVLVSFSTYFEKASNWTAYIYVNDGLCLEQNGTSPVGYYTFDLNDYIYLNKGDSFRIAVKLETDNLASFPISEKIRSNKVFYKKGISFFSYDGEEWYDLYNYEYEAEGHIYDSQVACIKAFTILPSISLQINNYSGIYVKDSFNITASISNDTLNGQVIYNISGDLFAVNLTDGVANLEISFNKSGIYSGSAYFVNDSIFSDKVNFTIEIMDKTLNTTVLLSNITSVVGKVVVINATVIDENGDSVSNGNVTFIIGNDTFICPVLNGSAVEMLSFDKPGNYTVFSFFEGVNYYPSSNVTNVMINDASILYVSTTGDDNNLGTRDSPLATLAYAIEITETGNIVLLDGIHKANGLTIDKTLNITGEGDATIDADKTDHIMYIYSTGDVTISNVNMINGKNTAESGALLGNAGKLTLINTTLSDSISNNNGGAIYNVGTLTIINSIFNNNTANLGGAIYSGDNSKKALNIKIVNTTFIDNTALGNLNNKGGGAIYAQASSGDFIIQNVTFKNNKAGKYGGGALFAIQMDSIKISDSKFINNSAESNENYGGGAIAIIGGNYQREGTTTITNTLFENNNADMAGGAIYLKGTTLDISNSVLVNNYDANGIVIFSAPTSNSVNSKVTANDNWWGSNDNPTSLISRNAVKTLNRWAILTIENDTAIAEGNNVNIVVSLTNYTTGSENGILSKPITIKRNVSVQTSFEEIDGVLNNGIYELNYNVPGGLKLISATVDDQTVVLYVVETEALINLEDVIGKKGSKVNITAQITTSDSQTINDGVIYFYVNSKLIGSAYVLNNNATLLYLILQDEGIYNLTAEYISSSGAFNASNVTKTLNVSGLNNIVRQDNFFDFFDEDGIILDDIIFDELIFEGGFNNPLPQIITLDNPIKITGDNAVLNNIVFMVMADGVELNNLTLNADKDFMMNGAALILVTSKYVSLINNKFNYTAPENTEAYVIYADSANGLKLIDNEITFTSTFTEKGIFTNALFITDSSGVEIRNNTMDITIPSVDIDYDSMSEETVYSEGIFIEKANSAVISDNNIAVKYNNAVGNMDTLRAVDIISSDDVLIENNVISIEGHKYVYALVINGNDFNINNNSIDASSDINYVNGININGPASGIVQFNTISAVSPNASYPIYSSAYNGNVYVEYENNTVYGSANDVYGIYVSGTDENITNNNVTLTGNFTIAIASLADNVIVSKNTIESLASNEGTALNMDIIPCVTSGVTSVMGNSIVDDNIILTTGNYTVNIIKGKAINNYLIANNTAGDKSVYPREGYVLIENNTPLMKTANLTVNNVSFNVGDEIVFNVTLTDEDNNPLANYTVDLDVNGTNYHALTDKDGIATFEVDSLPEGIYEMEFIVDNENIVELIEETAILNITLNNLEVNVVVSNIREGEDLIINVTVPDNLKEDLIITINNTDYTIRNSDSIIISDLTARKYSISVYYPGDDYYNEYSDELNVTVYGKDEIAVDINEPFEGEDLIINVDGPKDITGNVTITVGNETFDIPFENGNANVTISNISKGVYPISINYPGDDYYGPYTFEGNVTVNAKVVPKENLTLEASVDPITVGEDAVIVVSGLANATGEVVATVNGENFTGVIDNGVASIVVSGLTENVTALISYAGDDNYNNASTSVDIIVNPVPKENATYEISAPEVNEGEDAVITITLPEDATGNVTIGNTTVPVVKGTASVTISDLPVGNYTIPVTYSGDDKYNPINDSVNVTVNPKVVPKENLTLDASVDSITVGEDAIIVVSGLANATGEVVATVNGENFTGVIDNGVASIVVSGLTENVTALISYAGDDNYNAASTSVNITVNPTPVPKKDLTLNASAMTFGQNVTIIITGFENATGNVTVTIGEDNYTSPIMMGMAFVSIPQMDENVTAYIYYPGDDNYNNASTSVDIIAKINLNLTASADPIYAGENATIIITGFEKATGNVTVIAGRGFYNATIADGTATVTVPGLNNTTTAYILYVGDSNYNIAYTSVNITVLPVPTPKENLTLEVSAEPIIVGEDAVIVVSGLDDATGNVTAVVNGEEYSAEIVDGTASIIVPGLTENATALISYPGDDNYNAANATVDITVNPDPVPPKENLTLDVTADSVTVGEDAVIVVSGLANATGNVTATVNGETYTAPIKDGAATITVPGLTENATVVITYPGDDKYNNFTESVDVTVNPKPKENATMDIDVPPVTEGQNTTIDVELPEDATGTVIATIDGKNYTAPVKDGKATITIPELAAGNYTVPVTYSGDDKYNPVTKEVNVTVEEDKSDIISAPDVTKYYKGSERFVVSVTDYQGNPLANKTATIVINGATYTRTTNANGNTSIALGLNSGVYNVTTTVDNQTVNSVVTILATVNGTDIVKMYRNGTQYYATFLDSEGNFLADGTAVKFNINGVMYDRKVSGGKGQAKLNINLEQGTYVITAINPETGENAANNITVLSLLTENNDLTKYYRNASQYTVKVLDEYGKAVGAGVTVKFNINGVFYERQTNASGIAKLNINLQPGDYVITAEYNNCRVSNDIKVLPVLSASDISMKYRDGTKFVATLVDGQGKPYAGQNIEFNINGVFYNRATDSNGQAKLNINLMAGEYIITSSFNGASISNTIKITA